MREDILALAEESIAAVGVLREEATLVFLERIAQTIASALTAGGKVLIAGNGGSLCDAMHFAEELTGVFRSLRPALPAIALSDAGHMSCVGNDLGYDAVFARAVAAYGKPGDVFIALTTSGNSPNLVKAVTEATERGLTSIAFLGRGGGSLKGMAHYEWIVDGFKTSDRIQETHMAALHILIALIEKLLFGIESVGAVANASVSSSISSTFSTVN